MVILYNIYRIYNLGLKHHKSLMRIVIILNTVIVSLFKFCSPHSLSVQIQASLVKFLLLQRSNATFSFPHTALMGTWFQTFLDLLVVRQRFAISGQGKIYFGFSACTTKTNAQCANHAVLSFIRKQNCEKALRDDVKMRIPHSNAFIDLNKDFTAGE